MIKSFKSKPLERFFTKNDSKGLNPDHIRKISNILTTLSIADRISDIAAYNSYRLHSLTGNFSGFWSVIVSANYRIIFRFEEGNVFDVDYIDYH